MTLIEQLEKAEGPDTNLDGMIAEVIFAAQDVVHIGDGVVGPADNHVLQQAKPYTSSIDAALTLVPDGWEPWIDMCVSQRVNELPECDLWGVETKIGPDGLPYNDRVKGNAKTPALAICAAALKARENNDG